MPTIFLRTCAVAAFNLRSGQELGHTYLHRQPADLQPAILDKPAYTLLLAVLPEATMLAAMLLCQNKLTSTRSVHHSTARATRAQCEPHLRRRTKSLDVQPLKDLIQWVAVQGADVNFACQGNTLQQAVMRGCISTPRVSCFVLVHSRAAGKLRPDSHRELSERMRCPGRLL